jgi:DNA-directed RNA polymerase subunit E'/Rpb7|tara:strand:- start:29 stop:532 length:504 start_codon:yes stop_codon:yes gene_type:complete
MKSELISEQILTDEIYLNSDDINHDINGLINIKLKEKLEGKCINIGFIINNSILIINRSKYGKCVGDNKIKYIVNYKTKVVSPVIGSIIACHVKNITKAGVVAYIKLSDYGDYDTNIFTESPLVILIPLNRFDDKSINSGDKIDIEITAMRIKYKNQTIQIIGRPIK